jgi:AAA15 family ATPase/GTPase
MIDSLHIQNYRLFKDLKIDKLGQVNLIAGKNNTGKTALLEALRILSFSGAGKFIISDILKSRGEFDYGSLVECKSLFYKEQENHLSISSVNDGKKFEIAIGVEISESIFSTIEKIIVYRNDEPFYYYDFPNINQLITSEYLVFIPMLIHVDFLIKYWENISLTIMEKDVVSIINIIEPKIKAIRVDSRNVKVLLENSKTPVPLKSLGDGINRLFAIALALVNAQNKILIIDEFEVGLHHSIQKQLWEIIFKYAKEWNIQVFVTTHSRDTVEAFTEVWNKSEDNIKMGNYFRLQRSKKDSEQIEAVIYDNEMLEIAVNSRNIEMR